jgi:hypothetical protein
MTSTGVSICPAAPIAADHSRKTTLFLVNAPNAMLLISGTLHPSLMSKRNVTEKSLRVKRERNDLVLDRFVSVDIYLRAVL